MGTENRFRVAADLPEADMAELRYAAKKRNVKPGYEAQLWLRSKAQECREARIAAGEELWVEPERPTPTPPMNQLRPWEN